MKVHYKLTLYSEGNTSVKREYIFAAEESIVNPEIFGQQKTILNQQLMKINIAAIDKFLPALKTHKSNLTKKFMSKCNSLRIQ